MEFFIARHDHGYLRGLSVGGLHLGRVVTRIDRRSRIVTLSDGSTRYVPEAEAV